jgi:large subunit ribosomal protein L15
VTINLGQLQQWIDTGRLNPEEKVTMATLRVSGISKLTKAYEKGIKILGDGADIFAAKLDVEVLTRYSPRRAMALRKAIAEIYLTVRG